MATATFSSFFQISANWISLSVSGGQLLWEESVTIYKEKSGLQVETKLFVPLVSAETASNWGRYEEGRETLVVVAFPWDKLIEDHPRIASAASIGGATQLTAADLVQYETCSFDTDETEPGVSFMSGLEKGALQKFVSVNGFQAPLAVVMGSEPMGVVASLIMLLVSGLLLAGSIFWIRKRRRAKALRAAASGGFRAGLEEGLRSAVESGVSKAI